MRKKLLIALFTLFTFQQCHDLNSEKPEFSAAQVVQEVKDWYVNGLSPQGNNALTSKTGFTSIALWNEAKTYKGSGKDKYVTVVPLVAYSEKQPQSWFSLISFRNKQKVSGFIVQVIPDKNYLLKKSQTKTNIAFSGQIKIKSKSGKQMKTFLCKEGNAKPLIKSATSTFRTMDEGDEEMLDGGMLDAVEIIGISDDATWLDDVTVTATPLYDFADYSWLWVDANVGSVDNVDTSPLYDYNNDGRLDIPIPIPPPAVEVIVKGPQKKVDDPKKYFKCFTTNSAAKLTIYSDQPVAGTNASYNGTRDVGHSFISIEQGDNIRTIGFYPDGMAIPGLPNNTGVLGNDEGHGFDVGVSLDITASELAKLLDYIYNQTPAAYNLNSCNCTSFVISACAAIDIKLPQTQGTWPGGQGVCPGAFGEDLRNLSIPGRWLTKIESDGLSGVSQNQGSCE